MEVVGLQRLFFLPFPNNFQIPLAIKHILSLQQTDFNFMLIGLSQFHNHAQDFAKSDPILAGHWTISYPEPSNFFTAHFRRACTVKKLEGSGYEIGHWTIKLGRQNGRLLHWPKCSCVRTKTKLWKLLLRPCPRCLFAKFDCPVCHF